jgi:hypothetical protein
MRDAPMACIPRDGRVRFNSCTQYGARCGKRGMGKARTIAVESETGRKGKNESGGPV